MRVCVFVCWKMKRIIVVHIYIYIYIYIIKRSTMMKGVLDSSLQFERAIQSVWITVIKL